MHVCTCTLPNDVYTCTIQVGCPLSLAYHSCPVEREIDREREDGLSVVLMVWVRVGTHRTHRLSLDAAAVMLLIDIIWDIVYTCRGARYVLRNSIDSPGDVV